MSAEMGPGFSRAQWRTLCGCALGSIFGYGTVVVVAFALLVPPLMRERGWSHDQVALVISIKGLTAMAMAPAAGVLIDRLGARRIIAASSVATAGLLLALGSTTHLESFYLLYALLIVAASGVMPTSYTHAVVGGFAARRGLAIGIVMAAVGIGAIVAPPLLHAVVSAHGVKGAYHTLAALALLFGLGAALIIPPSQAREAPLATDGEGEAVLREAIRPAGRKLLLAAGLLGVFTGATWGQLMPLMLDRGVTETAAAYAMSGLAAAIVVGRLLSGWMLDRCFAPWVSAAFLSPVLIGWLMLGFGGAATLAIASAVMIGIGLGAEFDFLSYLTGRYIQQRVYGAFYGLLFSMTSLGAALSPVVFSWWRAHAIGEAGALATMALVTLLAIIALLRLGPYPPQPQVR